jgi:hypothetical protein
MARMKPLLTVLSFALFGATLLAAESKDSRVYEMRTYYAAPGKLDDLNKRFREHTLALFEKHGMENIGYWVPLENADNKLVYIIAHKSREAAKASWKSFGADPDWKAAAKASEANGKLVSKVESRFMQLTDFSPAIKPSKSGEARVFELREYTASSNNLKALDARFRDHTTKLFEKHGMENVGYWHLTPDQNGADNTLIYILAHKSKDAGEASFAAFRKDPTWVKAKDASEKAAGGSLTEGGQAGVKSTFMRPTNYSPMK